MHSLESHIPVETKRMKQKPTTLLKSIKRLFHALFILAVKNWFRSQKSLKGRILDKDLYILLKGWQSISLLLFLINAEPHN